MIARTWRGWTRPEDTEAYASYVKETGLAEYAKTPGNIAAYLLHREDGDRTEFIAISLWESAGSIEAFAGNDTSQAVFYPQDDHYLTEWETTASHYHVTEPGEKR